MVSSVANSIAQSGRFDEDKHRRSSLWYTVPMQEVNVIVAGAGILGCTVARVLVVQLEFAHVFRKNLAF